VAKFSAKIATAGPSKPAPKAVQCYQCKGYGHIMSECPNQLVFTIDEEPLEEEQTYFDSPPDSKDQKLKLKTYIQNNIKNNQ
jgi:Zinc knuckle